MEPTILASHVIVTVLEAVLYQERWSGIAVFPHGPPEASVATSVQDDASAVVFLGPGWWLARESYHSTLACVHGGRRGIASQPCPCHLVLHPAPLSTAPSADQPSQHAPRWSLCASSETACLSRDCCSRVQAGCASRATPMPLCPHTPTKPEVILDCVLAAARVCVQR